MNDLKLVALVEALDLSIDLACVLFGRHVRCLLDSFCMACLCMCDSLSGMWAEFRS
jgi:hypothetical protein